MADRNTITVPASGLSKKLPITLTCHHELFAKPYCWKALSTSIESNHDKNNLRFKAIAAKMALKDAFHMRYHTIDLHKQGAKLRQRNKNTRSPNDDWSMENDRSAQVSSQTAHKHRDGVFTDESILAASDDWILEKCTQSKATSIALQRYITDCGEGSLAKLIRVAEKRLAQLIYHRFGNYIIQHLLIRSPHFTAVVRSYCRPRFAAFVANEYSSRVAQKLIEHDGRFRSFASKCFGRDIPFFLPQQTAWYLIVSVVRFAVTEEERDIVSRYMQRCSSSWFENKNFMKLLAIYLEHCSAEQVKSFVSRVQLEKNFLHFLQDKLSCLIVFKLLERNEQSCERILLGRLSKDAASLLQTHFFGFLVGMIAHSEQTKSTALSIGLGLRSACESTFKSLFEKPVLFQLFSGAVTVLSLQEIQQL